MRLGMNVKFAAPPMFFAGGAVCWVPCAAQHFTAQPKCVVAVRKHVRLKCGLPCVALASVKQRASCVAPTDVVQLLLCVCAVFFICYISFFSFAVFDERAECTDMVLKDHIL